MDKQEALNPVATNAAIEMDDVPVYQHDQPFLDQSGIVTHKKHTAIAVTIIVFVLVVIAVVIAVKVTGNSDDDTDFPTIPHLPDPEQEYWPDPEQEYWPDQNYPGGSKGGCSIYNTTIHPQNYICGRDEMTSENGTISESKCPHVCQAIYGFHDHFDALYNSDTHQCYCTKSSWYYAHQDDSDCFNVSAADGDFRMWSQNCWIKGRPYNLETESNLLASIEFIDCDDYTFYDDDEWKRLIQNGLSNEPDSETASKWIEQGLEEHASIGTFAKFTVELMSIGAPLWMIELANAAAADEIRHAQISFDIANAYLGGVQCVVPGIFPHHQVDVDGDWNRIAVDTAIGGCIGETAAAFRMIKSAEQSLYEDAVRQIAMDEVRHAALAWAVLDWMIEKSESHGDHLDVAREDWWSSQETLNGIAPEIGALVYEVLIPSILEEIKAWDHRQFHDEVLDTLTFFISNASSPQGCGA